MNDNNNYSFSVCIESRIMHLEERLDELDRMQNQVKKHDLIDKIHVKLKSVEKTEEKLKMFKERAQNILLELNSL